MCGEEEEPASCFIFCKQIMCC